MATAEGIFPKDGNDPLFNSEINQFEANVRYNPIFYNTINDFNMGILTHSSTVWTFINTNNSTRTTDAGTTWANVSLDDIAMNGNSTTVDSDKTNAFVIESGGDSIFRSTNSGDNWTETNAAITNATSYFAVSAPTTNVAVVGMDRGTAARGIGRSIDGGANWVVASSGPVADVPVIDMVDANNGIAIDDSGNIWTTSNAGVDWSDSGQNSAVNPTSTSSMIALTSTTYVMSHSSNVDCIETGNTTSGGTVKVHHRDMSTANVLLSNIVQTNAGNLYCILYDFSGGESQVSITMLKSRDSGAIWSAGALPNFGFAAPHTPYLGHLAEYGTDKLVYIAGERQLTTIDETWDG